MPKMLPRLESIAVTIALLRLELWLYVENGKGGAQVKAIIFNSGGAIWSIMDDKYRAAW